MNTYAVRIEGRNLSILNRDENRLEKLGFFTTRVVHAKGTQQAEELALANVRNDLNSKNIVQNEKSDPPTLNAQLMTVAWMVNRWLTDQC